MFASILLVVALVGIEVLSSYFVPAWPARAINAREPARARTLATRFTNQPWLADPDSRVAAELETLLPGAEPRTE